MKHATIKLAKATVKVTIEVELREKRSVSPHRTIDLDPIDEYVELAICMRGFECDARGRLRESVGGQGIDYVLEHFGDREHVTELCALWRAWHLNGLRAGHRFQRAFLEQCAERLEAIHRESGLDRFSLESEALTLADRNPFRGYKYGSAWLVEPLPPIVVERIEWLVGELGGAFEKDLDPANAGLALTKGLSVCQK